MACADGSGSARARTMAMRAASTRFTAAAAGTYSINALWEDVDDCCTTNGTGADVHVVRELRRPIDVGNEVHGRQMHDGPGPNLCDDSSKGGGVADVVGVLGQAGMDMDVEFQNMFEKMLPSKREVRRLSVREARRVLIEELGVEPGPELRRVHQAVLAGDSPEPERAPEPDAEPWLDAS